MGLLGRLFGKSDDRDAATDRCNECGMSGGRHTDWCPLVAEREEDPRTDRPDRSPQGAGG